MAPSGITRRHFLESLAAGAGTLALGACGDRSTSPTDDSGLPRPEQSGIEHIVVVMMENRSFDHFLGWVPGADGRQAGLRYIDRGGSERETYPLAPDFRGCGHPDPDHSYEGGRAELAGGACDGWLRAGANDEFAIGYYRESDLAFFGQAAHEWTTLDRYFSSIMAETFPNRVYQHAAQTDRIHNTSDRCVLPTIWDRLAAAGLSGRYYFSDLPFLALWGDRYTALGRSFDEFVADCAAGTLPHVCFVEPRFLAQGSAPQTDDHPPADIRDGQAFLSRVYTAVTTGPRWTSTVLVINYDEWGGFFEHVPPPRASIPPADAAAGNTDGLLGFLVPALLIAPWARAGAVSHGTFDHTSVLRMIEWRWRLAPLTVRDRTARNLATALDFSNSRATAPAIVVSAGPYSPPCAAADVAAARMPDEWTALAELARRSGWPT